MRNLSTLIPLSILLFAACSQELGFEKAPEAIETQTATFKNKIIVPDVPLKSSTETDYLKWTDIDIDWEAIPVHGTQTATLHNLNDNHSSADNYFSRDLTTLADLRQSTVTLPYGNYTIYSKDCNCFRDVEDDWNFSKENTTFTQNMFFDDALFILNLQTITTPKIVDTDLYLESFPYQVEIGVLLSLIHIYAADD